MTELDRVGNTDNFYFRGGSVVTRFCKSARSARRQREKKKWNICTDVVLLHIYTKILGVRLPVYPVIKNKVLMLIKV